MRLRSCSDRCAIANAAGDLCAVGVVTGAMIGLLADGHETTRGVAAVIAVLLVACGVATLLGLALASLDRRSTGGDDEFAAGPFPDDFDGSEAAPRFAPRRWSRIGTLRRFDPCDPAGTTIDQDGGERSGRFVASATIAGSAPGGAVWLGRLRRDLRVLLENQVETRGLLARDVYQVPEEWLDDVMRMRLSGVAR